MGRPAKDIFEHVLQGTTQRVNAGESYVAGSLPKPPKFLSKDARKKFKHLVHQLSERRAVTAGDGDLIAIYCSQDERWQQALAKIREEGAIRIYTRLSASGEPVQVEKANLNLTIAKDCERAMVGILTRLGLTPKDRESVRPTSPVKSKNTPPHPDSCAGVEQELARLRVLQAAERDAANEPAPDEPEIDMEALDKAMEAL